MFLLSIKLQFDIFMFSICLKILLHCLLTFTVSCKTAIILVLFPSCAAKIFSLALLFCIYHVYCVAFSIFLLLLVYIVSWITWFILCIKFRKKISHYLFKLIVNTSTPLPEQFLCNCNYTELSIFCYLNSILSLCYI